MTRSENGIIQLDRDAIVRMLQVRRDAEKIKLVDPKLADTVDMVRFIADVNRVHNVVIAVLDEMIGAIYSVQAELDKGNYMWPFHSDGKLVSEMTQGVES